jgi:hypothetical protein
MNLNRKTHRVWPSLISSQAVDGYTQPRRTDSYPLATGYWSPPGKGARSQNLGSRRYDDECKSTAANF